jgi:hypothetical protein
MHFLTGGCMADRTIEMVEAELDAMNANYQAMLIDRNDWKQKARNNEGMAESLAELLDVLEKYLNPVDNRAAYIALVDARHAYLKATA